MNTKPFTLDRTVRLLITVVGVVAGIYIINLLKEPLLPFLLAWLVAYLLYPIVKFFQFKLKFKNRDLSIAATFLMLLVVMALFILLIAPTIVKEAQQLMQIINVYVAADTGKTLLPNSWYNYLLNHIDIEKITAMVNGADVMKFVQEFSQNIWSLLTLSVSTIIKIVSWFIVLLYLIFILHDYEKIEIGFKKLIPYKYKTYVLTLFSDVEKSMNCYFRGQALIAFSVGILFSIGFLIMGLPLAIPLGLFIGLLNLVPYLQIIGFLPTVILCLIQAADTNGNFWIILIFAILVFAVVQLIQDVFLTPRIMGKAIGLNPAIILLSLSIWGTLMGVMGMIIALPLTSLLLAYYERYIIKGEQIVLDAVPSETIPSEPVASTQAPKDKEE